MRDGNFSRLRRLEGSKIVVSLPMRDGNSPADMARWLDIAVVSLPMRDGNVGSLSDIFTQDMLLAYL